MGIRQFSGKVPHSVWVVRVPQERRLWRCFRCSLQVLRVGDAIFDPNEDGSALVPHPCPFEPEDWRPHVNGIATGGMVRRFKHVPGSAVLHACRVHGCVEAVGKSTTRKYFCVKHWSRLPAGLCRSILDAAHPAESRRLVTLARRYLGKTHKA